MFEAIFETTNSRLALGVFVGLVSGFLHGYSGFAGGLLLSPLLAILYGPVEGIFASGVAGIAGPCDLMSGNSIGVCALCPTWRHAPRWGDPLFCYSMKATKPPWRLQNAARSRYRA
jgi:hypothetical protein